MTVAELIKQLFLLPQYLPVGEWVYPHPDGKDFGEFKYVVVNKDHVVIHG